MDSYVVRIYRRVGQESRILIGTAELVGTGKRLKILVRLPHRGVCDPGRIRVPPPASLQCGTGVAIRLGGARSLRPESPLSNTPLRPRATSMVCSRYGGKKGPVLANLGEVDDPEPDLWPERPGAGSQSVTDGEPALFKARGRGLPPPTGCFLSLSCDSPFAEPSLTSLARARCPWARNGRGTSDTGSAGSISSPGSDRFRRRMPRTPASLRRRGRGRFQGRDPNPRIARGSSRPESAGDPPAPAPVHCAKGRRRSLSSRGCSSGVLRGPDPMRDLARLTIPGM